MRIAHFIQARIIRAIHTVAPTHSFTHPNKSNQLVFFI
jgi:hypothetical protein